MAKADDVLKNNHTEQIAWVDMQIQKGNNSIFLNSQLARDHWEALNQDSLILSDDDIEKFIVRFLSDSGKKKLINKLRVSATRRKKPSNLKMLQVPLESSNQTRLKELRELSGLNNTELVNLMIKKSKWNKGEDGQLEIDI